MRERQSLWQRYLKTIAGACAGVSLAYNIFTDRQVHLCRQDHILAIDCGADYIRRQPVLKQTSLQQLVEDLQTLEQELMTLLLFSEQGQTVAQRRQRDGNIPCHGGVLY